MSSIWGGLRRKVGWDVLDEDEVVVWPSDDVPEPEVEDCPGLECKNAPTAKPLISPESAKRMTASTAMERDELLPVLIEPWPGSVFKYMRPLLSCSYMIIYPMIAYL